ncbi:hypothetical protein GUITHDRAFT_150769 [Guillardia theta CCMP2712]|uniref:t-SNARE coiled-coil homology domain-containing protein n=1 Tax=Guillardia theta (strain CCMP2712) TaxID=905079 RepID=L1JUZ1_GUITC|nr:hypothetical protein GUITHDRAFT_150769 [Guillardia theta CCMP2712]EKX52376.1 hypothetical protein GUITHDRAFT_150769 [Guillardia theta CCMP2712]|eukprot:XP_005839356.1 hypothetical protein GUITHDRAFT_150769 [Guillardia theta CCMP2712]
MNETSKIAKRIKDSLHDMESENETYKEKHGEGSSQAKIHINIHGSLTKKFVELMQEYEETQGKYKSLLHERVERQVKVVNPNATEEEIKQAVESGGSDIFADRLLSKADQVALNAYAEVQSKHEELMKLEASIREVHQLFMDMAIMVEQQGEMLDNIEELVSKSAEYTESGVEQLIQAKKLQKKARKKMCCLVVCFTVGLLIMLSFVTNFLIPRI